MRKILKSTPKTKTYLDNLPKLYGIFMWAKWGILELPWTGKYNKDGIPLVYIYHDFNGEYDEYILNTINMASSGSFWGWYEDKEAAKEEQIKLNEALKRGEIGYDESGEA